MANLPRIFQTIGIYGVGLLGGSIGYSLKKDFPDTRIIGIGRSEDRLKVAKSLKVIDSYTTNPLQIPESLDLLVVCTPVGKLAGHVKESLSAMKPNGVITDVGSTKVTVVQQCEAIVGNKCRFVGAHPMAGSHKTGVESASADLFKGKTCVVTETILSDEDAVSLVSDFWVSLGMRVVRMKPEQHDKLVARSSHLPHIVAAALCHVVKNSGSSILPVIGDGFKDATRIAAGDTDMWTDIAFENREEILIALQEMESMLAKCKEYLALEDSSALYEFFRQIQNWKNEQNL